MKDDSNEAAFSVKYTTVLSHKVQKYTEMEPKQLLKKTYKMKLKLEQNFGLLYVFLSSV